MKENEPKTQRLESKDKIKNSINRVLGVPHKAFDRYVLYFNLIATSQGRQVLKNPEWREFILNREVRTGLLEGSILSNDLYYPNEEGTSLASRQALAGQWVGYDFKRPSEFGKSVKKEGKQVKQGKLVTFALDEIIKNPSSRYTPSYLLDLLSEKHVLKAEFCNISTLLEYGFVEETTYEEAYREVGLFDKYKTLMTLSQLKEKKLYRVTPKGNTLVGLDSESGTREEKSEEEKALRPAFEF